MMVDQSMSNTSDPRWNERFTWYYFSDKEVFGQTTDAELEHRAAELKRRGITVAILFTCTHFRFSFYPHWDEIINCIGRITRSCHKYGIRVVEHSSAVLVHDLNSAHGRKRFDGDIGSYTNWESTADDWGEVVEFLTDNPSIDGVSYKSMCQIDGAAGQLSNTQYDCPIMCHNNPDYKRLYLAYLKRVCATGIDGMMNDDVAFFDGACTCQHCRKLFFVETGYTLPEPEGWAEFFGDFSNPVYLAFERFKRANISEFHHMLNAQYREWGYDFIYPSYISDLLKHNPTSGDLDCVSDIATFLFQENCFSAIMKDSWPDFMTEAVHRFARAKRHGIPSMSMFYPERADSVYFSWAFSRAWGQMYTGTSHGMDISELEAPYREFETRHARLFEAPEKREDISFYFSRKTRDFVGGPDKRITKPFMSCIQASYISGLCTDMVFEDDTEEELAKRDCIVASHVYMAEDEEILRLSRYVRQGGRLIILGDFARLDPDGKPRQAVRVLELLGAASQVYLSEYKGEAQVAYKGQTLSIHKADAPLQFTLKQDARAVCTSAAGDVLGILEEINKGELIWIPAEINENEFQPTIWASRRQKEAAVAEAVPSVFNTLRATTGKLLRILSGNPKVRVESESEDVIASSFVVRGGLAVHLINIADTVESEPREITHFTVIPNFAPGAKRMPKINLEIEKPGGAEQMSAVLYSPEFADGLPLSVEDGGKTLKLRIPAETFAAYAVIDIKLTTK